MIIELDTKIANPEEMTALIALLASLGGRLPAAAPLSRLEYDRRVDEQDGEPPATRPLPSETLLDAAANAAARPAPPAPPAPDDTGETLDPTSLDAEGIPWDSRIHSTPAKQNSDKTWRKRRGVNEVEYGKIHAELQAGAAPNEVTGTAAPSTDTQAGETAQNRPAPPPPTSSTASEAARPTPPAPPVAESASTAAQAPGPAAAANATGGGRFETFGDFVQAVNAIRTPAIPYLELNTMVQDVGVNGRFSDMKDHPDRWEMFFDLAGGR